MKVLFISRSTLFTVPGGDTIQMQMTAAELRKLGVEVDIVAGNKGLNYEEYDLVHFFNIIRPAALLYHFKKCPKPKAISPIYVDYSEYETKATTGIRNLIANHISKHAMEYLKTIARWILNGEKGFSLEYLFRGQKNSVVSLLKRSDFILPNTLSEINRLTKDFGSCPAFHLINHGVDTSIFATSKTDGIRNGVLCVARIEGGKNQLNLIRAMKGLEIKLTLIGRPSPNHQKYFKQCKKEAGSNVQFLDHMIQSDLIKHYANAKVHVLPSWFETCGLSTLEAVVMGCNIVITNKGDTFEIFGNQATYCDPADVGSIHNAVLKAYESDLNYRLKQRMDVDYTWEKAASQTLEAYKQMIK